MTERVDIAVIGAGPAGIAAAVTAAESGARVAVLDERRHAGGQIWQTDRGRIAPRARPWMARLQKSGVIIMPGTSIVDVTRVEQRVITVHTNHGLVRCNRMILACGARELFLPFPGWTLPGVTGAGGLQALMHDGLDVAGQRIVVAGSGPLLLQVAANLRARHAQVIRVAEQTTLRHLIRFTLSLTKPKLRQALSLWNPRLRTSQWVVAAHGKEKLEAVTIRGPRGNETVACDRLAAGFSLVPNLELPQLLGCDFTPAGVAVDEQQATSVPGIYAAGEVCGIKGVAGAIAEGICAGAVVCDRPLPSSARQQRDRELQFSRTLAIAFALRAELGELPEPDTLICRCEDVPHRQLQVHTDWTSAKLQTRCGMGACQGRICGAATRHLFGWGPQTVRPPLVPIPVGDLMTEGSAS